MKKELVLMTLLDFHVQCASFEQVVKLDPHCVSAVLQELQRSKREGGIDRGDVNQRLHRIHLEKMLDHHIRCTRAIAEVRN